MVEELNLIKTAVSYVVAPAEIKLHYNNNKLYLKWL